MSLNGLNSWGRRYALKSKVYRAEKSAPFPDDIDKFADGFSLIEESVSQAAV